MEKNATYVNFLTKPLIDNKREIFLYVQQFYRAFMKQKTIDEYPVFELE